MLVVAIAMLVMCGAWFCLRAMQQQPSELLTAPPSLLTVVEPTTIPATATPVVTPMATQLVTPTGMATIAPTSAPTKSPATLVPLAKPASPSVWVRARVLGGGACSPSNMCRVEVMYQVGGRHFVSRVTYVGNRYLFGSDVVTLLVDARTGRCLSPCRIF